jgi:hypothetical protein
MTRRTRKVLTLPPLVNGERMSEIGAYAPGTVVKRRRELARRLCDDDLPWKVVNLLEAVADMPDRRLCGQARELLSDLLIAGYHDRKVAWEE